MMAVKLIFVGLLLFVAALQTYSTKNAKDVKKNLPESVPSKLHICNSFVIVVDVSYNFLSRVSPFFSALSCVSLFRARCCNGSNFDNEGGSDHWFFM